MTNLKEFSASICHLFTPKLYSFLVDENSRLRSYLLYISDILSGAGQWGYCLLENEEMFQQNSHSMNLPRECVKGYLP